MRTPWERLREERERLGLSQSAFAEYGGVKKGAQINYEKGERKPDAEYFARIAAKGANVDYIITGTPPAVRRQLQRIKTATEMAQALAGGNAEALPRIQEVLFETLGRAEAATAEEEHLLTNYRDCSAEDQQQIQKLTERLAKPGEKT